MTCDLTDFEKDNEDIKVGDLDDTDNIPESRLDEEGEVTVKNDNNDMMDDDDTNTTNVQANVEHPNTDEIEQSLRIQIIEKIPEIHILNNFSCTEPLDFDQIVKKTADDSQSKIVYPDPTQEILNHDVEDIKFAGYNTIDIDLISNDRKQDNSQESYEKWLSQHKAIVKSSGKHFVGYIPIDKSMLKDLK